MVLVSVLHLWLSGSAPVAQSVMLDSITVQIHRIVKTQTN